MHGGAVKQIIAELLGRRGGVSFGKGTFLCDSGANNSGFNNNRGISFPFPLHHTRQVIFRETGFIERERKGRLSLPDRLAIFPLVPETNSKVIKRNVGTVCRSSPRELVAPSATNHRQSDSSS